MRRAVRAVVFKDNNLLLIKRNKFGKEYYTLPGGGMEIGESAEQALVREMYEETGVQLGDARLVSVEDAGEPYGVQYMYLADYVSGEPRLSSGSVEAEISAMGKNTYEPVWLPVSELPAAPFISDRTKNWLLKSIKEGFPEQAALI